MNAITATMRGLCAVVPLACALSACTTPPAPAPRTTATQLRVDTRSPTGLVDADHAGTAPPMAPHCRFTVTEAERCSAGDVVALFEPARTRIEACRGASGKVRVRVYDEGGKLKFRVEPGSSLDAAQRRCVLEALSTIGDDGDSNLSTGATVRPTGFSSLLTIEW